MSRHAGVGLRRARGLARSLTSRGAALATVVILCLVAAPLAQQGVGTAPAAAWPQFRGTPTLTGVSASTPPASLNVLWTFDAGDAIDSSAAIADGAVYVGVATGELVALNLSDGAVRWRYTASDLGIGESSPAVAGGRVYVGDLAGVLHAVDTADGKPVWTFKTGSEIKSSPVVVGDRVLIGSYDGNLYGLHVKDGSVAWQVKTDNYVHGTPAVADGVAYFAGCDEVFHGVRVADGTQVVEARFGAYTGASIALAGSMAYFGTFDNEVLAFDVKGEKVQWRYAHPDRSFPFNSSAAFVDGTVVVGGRDRMVHAIDAKTGKARWTHMTRARVESSPAVAGGRVYVGSGDGRFYVLSLDTGEKVWEYDMGGAVSASPAIADGRIVVGSQDGRLVCFGG